MEKGIWFSAFGLAIIGISIWGGTNNPYIFVFAVLGFISLFIGIFKILGVKGKGNASTKGV